MRIKTKTSSPKLKLAPQSPDPDGRRQKQRYPDGCISKASHCPNRVGLSRMPKPKMPWDLNNNMLALIFNIKIYFQHLDDRGRIESTAWIVPARRRRLQLLPYATQNLHVSTSIFRRDPRLNPKLLEVFCRCLPSWPVRCRSL